MSTQTGKPETKVRMRLLPHSSTSVGCTINDADDRNRKIDDHAANGELFQGNFGTFSIFCSDFQAAEVSIFQSDTSILIISQIRSYIALQL